MSKIQDKYRVEDDELEHLPAEQTEADPLRGAKIHRAGFDGCVVDIVVGKDTRERVYEVEYIDGEVEHFTAAQVQECRLLHSQEVPKKQLAARYGVSRRHISNIVRGVQYASV